MQFLIKALPLSVNSPKKCYVLPYRSYSSYGIVQLSLLIVMPTMINPLSDAVSGLCLEKMVNFSIPFIFLEI